MKKNHSVPDPVPVAVYARKSTDAKLEQEVNSISVQLAAARSYIESQRHLGWCCVDEEFYDNNISGATLKRPALQRLVNRIREGRIKVVVVNRLDRISRSLQQFLELMTFFEEYGVALVSVTQSINTGTSVGRLMLSIIMGFAEYEREMICERVTERMHAARMQGRFTGGRPILGYEIAPEGGRLEMNELESIRVRAIFGLYLELRSIKAVVLELRRRDWKNKQWITRDGAVFGGNHFTPATLHHLLTNPIYIGKVSLKGKIYDGKHEAIISGEVFDQVKAVLAGNSVHKGSRRRNVHGALLKGVLTCKSCETSFVHTYTKKSGRMYRYYTCANKRLNGANACPSPSIPAGEIESLAVEHLMSVGTNPELQDSVYRQLVEALEQKRLDAQKDRRSALNQLNRLTRELAASWEKDVSVSVVRHLESQIQEAEETLEKIESDADLTVPAKEDVVRILRDMQGLWPTFNVEEKTAFIQSIIREVEYDAVEGSVTLHFNDERFVCSPSGGVQ